MPEPQLPPGSATVSTWMDAATRIFRLTLAKSLPIAMFAILLAALPQMYWLTTGKPMDLLHPPADQAFWALSLVGFLGYQLLAAILMLRQRALLQGRAPDLASEFKLALERWPILIMTGLLGGALVLIGALALVLPGIIMLVCLLLLRPVVLFEACGPWQAVVRCVQLVRPLWWKVLAAWVVAGLIFIICVVAASACLQILEAAFTAAAGKPAAFTAFAAACSLGVQAVAWVYFSALWLVLYSAANSSA